MRRAVRYFATSIALVRLISAHVEGIGYDPFRVALLGSSVLIWHDLHHDGGPRALKLRLSYAGDISRFSASGRRYV